MLWSVFCNVAVWILTILLALFWDNLQCQKGFGGALGVMLFLYFGTSYINYTAQFSADYCADKFSFLRDMDRILKGNEAYLRFEGTFAQWVTFYGDTPSEHKEYSYYSEDFCFKSCQDVSPALELHHVPQQEKAAKPHCLPKCAGSRVSYERLTLELSLMYADDGTIDDVRKAREDFIKSKTEGNLSLEAIKEKPWEKSWSFGSNPFKKNQAHGSAVILVYAA